MGVIRDYERGLQVVHKVRQGKRVGRVMLDRALEAKARAEKVEHWEARQAEAVVAKAARLGEGVEKAEMELKREQSEVGALVLSVLDEIGAYAADAEAHRDMVMVGGEWISLRGIQSKVNEAHNTLSCLLAQVDEAREEQAAIQKRVDLAGQRKAQADEELAEVRAEIAAHDASADVRYQNTIIAREANSPVGPARARLEVQKKLRKTLKARLRQLNKKVVLLQQQRDHPSSTRSHTSMWAATNHPLQERRNGVAGGAGGGGESGGGGPGGTKRVVPSSFSYF